MAEHFLLTKECRDLPRHEISSLTDEQVVKKLSFLRWGFEDRQVCPGCGEIASHYVRAARRQWRCRSCARDFSLTSGTPFSHHKIPLRSLLQMMYSYLLAAKGMPAAQLSRETGHRWRTCWLFMSKVREILVKNRPTEQMSGLVQMDGGYFGGKRRDVNNHARRTDNAAYASIARRIEGAPTTRSKRLKQFSPGGAANAERRKNRRVIFVIRQVHSEKGRGAYRTVISVAKSENETDAVEMARRYVTEGTVLMTDEGGAFNQFNKWFDHRTVQHSMQWVKEDGTNDNQAESYYSRLRRAEYGVFHRFVPMYLLDYATEFAWREDTRRMPMREKFDSLLSQVFRGGPSRLFRGYHQGNIRQVEFLNT